MKSLLFIGFWKDAWQEMFKFLEEKQFQDEAFMKHLKEVLEGTKK